MMQTPLGTPLILFKASTSLVAHKQEIEIAFPEHQTDFETELAVVIGARAKNVSVEHARDFIFGYGIGEDISDRDLQKSEKQFGRDRKSTRLNSSHLGISYAVFCLKKKR